MKNRWMFALAIAFLLAACSGKQTVASKSAAAYREATAKGEKVGGGDGHAHHAGAEPAPAVDHSTMDHSTMDHSGHGAAASAGGHAEHAAPVGGHAQHAQHAAPAGGHAQHAAPEGAHAQHAAPASGHAQHAQHAAPTSGHAQHAQHAAPAGGHAQNAHHAAPTGAHAQHAQHSPLSPQSGERGLAPVSGTLQPDEFDAPAPVSVAEAQKAAGGGGGHEGHGEIYACPMHPEVTSATPGTCPKCGMQLVKKEK